MRPYLLLIVMLCLALPVVATMSEFIQSNPSTNNPSRYEVVHYQETFESGATGWTHYDGGMSPNNWHIHANGDAQANVWWMGDPALASGSNIGGYYDHQYLVLDTPARTVTSAASNLTFKMRHNVEAPGASGGYDGWDSINIRISTNNGDTWTVLTGSPAYQCQNSYAFGFEHGEGMGIPGWGGVTTGWVNASFNLSAYVNQSVKIRFAFASDPVQSTGDAPAMYGVMIDDIAFGGYTNNGVDDGQMTWSSLVPLGGDIWAIATDALAPSPTHVMRNQNASGTYNPSMMNYLVSPAIPLPTSGAIRCDFMLKGSFIDPNTFPEVDYYGWEISINNGVTWFAMSNPYGLASGSNYVYSDVPADWLSMTDGYSIDGIISDYAGETAKFRWYFKSDADTPNGPGIRIDDFKIYNEVFLAEPLHLAATVNGANVTLNWDAPGSGGGETEGWLSYDNGINNDSIGTSAAADFDVAAKWDAAGTYGIAPYIGMNITKIKFWPNETACSYAARIWTGAAGTLMVDQAVTNPTIGAWNEIVLTTPWTIPAQTVVMAGYRCNTTTGYPAGCDAGPQVEGYGNVMRYNGAWTTLTVLSPTLTNNWNIKVYVQDAAGREYLVGKDLPQNAQFAEGTLQASGVTVTRDRDVTQYKIYRDTVLINQIAGTLLTYTDMNVADGLHSYYVTAMYGSNESIPSNTVTALVLPAMYTEMSNDDGSAESGYNVGTTKQMAAKFNYNGSVTVKYAKIYVHTLGTALIIIRVFDNDGANGMPGTQIAQTQYPLAQIVQGWNLILLPDYITVADGDFYIAILETTGASQIGMDTSGNGNSFKKISTAWEPITQGDIMIRSIVQVSPNGTTQSIPMLSGWNLISLNVSPPDHTLATLLAPISASVQQVKGTEGIYIPGNPYSSLTSLTDGKAYTILMNAAITWNVTGNQIPTGTPIPLTDGWNMTAYLPQNSMALTAAMQSISAWLQQVKSSDGVYIPGNPYSTLSAMYPGHGYWIQLSGMHNLVYPASRETVMKPMPSKASVEVTKLPSSMVLLARCDWAQPGDILIAKVNGELRGAQELTSPEGFPAALLQIYTAEDNEEISLWLLHADGTETELANVLSSLANSTLGEYPEFIILEPKSEEVTPTPTQLNGCYPNPFNPSTTISFSVAESNTMLSVNIYNLRGQKVRQLTNANYKKGKHSLIWNGTDDQGRALSSGLYLIELKAGNYRKTAKAMLAK